MKPDPAAPADQLHLLRQQLILAQVRIMELEDDRDEQAPKRAELEQLLAEAQALADAKLEEAAHLAGVVTDLQSQQNQLRHTQHLTNEALNTARTERDRLTASLATAQEHGQRLEGNVVALARETAGLKESLSHLQHELGETKTVASARADRVTQLDVEVRTMKASRSWRWTAWLRSIERSLFRRQDHG